MFFYFISIYIIFDITEKLRENEKTKEQLLNLNKNKELNISKTIEENNKKLMKIY